MANSETILTLTYDFLLYLIPQLSKYPRDQKFVLGDRIETLALDILDDVIVAYYSKQKFERLQNANLKLERFWFSVLLAHPLCFTSTNDITNDYGFEITQSRN
ncbi:hypothetical protein IIA28_17760 [candidate division KSB1 bacterium]|nr:hypothetical protein [candidate division KSB1 bacterium]